MSGNTAMFWLLDVEAYDFDAGALKGADITGMLIIVSRQLWSIIRGNTVVSALIGPGVFKGMAKRGNIKVEIREYLSALVFNPSDLRLEEPVPLIDIVNPEVIDPLASSKTEEIYSLISKIIIEKGNILAADPLMKFRFEGNVPQMAHYDEQIKKIKISYVSGLQKAKFILGGTHGPIYRPFADYYRTGRFMNPIYTKLMMVNDSKFTKFRTNESTSDWMIVEKYGMTDATGVAAFKEEYEETLAIIHKNEDFFIYD